MTDYVSKYKLVFKDLASKRLLRVSRIAGGLTKALKVASVAIAGVGVAAGLAMVKLSNAFSQRADEIAKFTKETGFASDAMQQLEFIVERQGGSFDNAKNGIRTFNKNLGELRGGFGTLETSLKKMDPVLKQNLLNAKNSSDAYFLFLEAIAATPDAANKAALAAAGFSKRGGKDILRLTANGVEGIEALRKEALRFRPPITKDQLRAAEVYQDSLTNLRAVIGSLGDSAGSKLLPVMTDISDRFTEFVVNNREFINQNLGDLFAKIGEFVRGIDFKTVTEKGKGFFIALISGGKTAVNVINKMGGLPMILKSLLAVMVVGKVVAFASSLAALPFLLNPISLAIIATVAAGALIVANWDKIRAKAEELGIDVDAVFAFMRKAVAVAVPIMEAHVKRMISAFKVLIKSGVAVAKFLTPAFKLIVRNMKTTARVISYLVGGAIDRFKMFKSVAVSIFGAVSDTVSQFSDGLTPYVDLIGGIFTKIQGKIFVAFDVVKSHMMSVWDSLKSIIASSVNFYIRQINRLLSVYNKAAASSVGKRIGLDEIELVKNINVNTAQNVQPANDRSPVKIDLNLDGKIDGARVKIGASSNSGDVNIGSNMPIGRVSF